MQGPVLSMSELWAFPAQVLPGGFPGITSSFRAHSMFLRWVIGLFLCLPLEGCILLWKSSD